jgi:hypothetical protein
MLHPRSPFGSGISRKRRSNEPAARPIIAAGHPSNPILHPRQPGVEADPPGLAVAGSGLGLAAGGAALWISGTSLAAGTRFVIGLGLIALGLLLDLPVRLAHWFARLRVVELEVLRDATAPEQGSALGQRAYLWTSKRRPTS